VRRRSTSVPSLSTTRTLCRRTLAVLCNVFAVLRMAVISDRSFPVLNHTLKASPRLPTRKHTACKCANKKPHETRGVGARRYARTCHASYTTAALVPRCDTPRRRLASSDRWIRCRTCKHAFERFRYRRAWVRYMMLPTSVPLRRRRRSRRRSTRARSGRD
jgi:hypothetical protein